MTQPNRTRPTALRSGTALAGALAGLMALATPAPAQTAGGTLGIDCEVPRRTDTGKLILGDDGSWRALCEADRATALHYADLVQSTRARLTMALAQLPAPLWGDLVRHLRDDDRIGTWRYDNAAILAGLEDLDADLGATATRWQGGILAADDWLTGAPVNADWHGALRARACGVETDGRVAPGAMVLVWLDPDAVRSRWTPAMVQRAVRAWLERQSDPFVAADRIPGIVTAPTPGTRALVGPDGRMRNLDACFATLRDGVPEGALAMRLTLSDPLETGTRTVANCGPGQVGARRYTWARRGGVFLVPNDAIHLDKAARADRGEPLLGQHPNLPLRGVGVGEDVPEDLLVWYLTENGCDDPDTRDIVRTAECDGDLNGQPVKGSVVRSFRFREVQSDPVDPYRIDWIPVMPKGGPGTGCRDCDDVGRDVPQGSTHAVWSETVLFCEGNLPESDAPIISEPVETNFPIPDCATAWGGRFNEGGRTGYHRRITYPPGWSIDDVEVRHIEDDCFARVPQSETLTETRGGPACPAGHVGAITESRTLRYDWFHRVFAITKGRDAGPTHADWQRSLPDRATFAEAQAHLDAGNAAGPSGVYDRVTMTVARDWHTSGNTCAPPPPPSGGGDGQYSFDVDGDGQGDYHSYSAAQNDGYTSADIDEVPNDCGACNGPGDGGPGSSSDNGSDSGGWSSGWICFARDTPVTLTDGRVLPIAALRPDDQLRRSGRVITVLPSSDCDIWRLNGVEVTGHHWVRHEGVWIEVRDHPDAAPCPRRLPLPLVNLITETGTIWIGEDCYADYVTQMTPALREGDGALSLHTAPLEEMT